MKKEEFRPVFRNTTLVAERRRKQLEDVQGLGGNARKLKVLFVEEGLGCRSVLARAVFESVLSQDEELRHLVDCDVAAILPHSEATPIQADTRAVEIASRHNLSSKNSFTKTIRAFDDVNDSVNFDLILVMDRFDHAEVLKEVAAYDNIFPGGYYAAKVRRLAGFKACTETHCIVQGLLGDSSVAKQGQEEEEEDQLPRSYSNSNSQVSSSEEEDKLDISDPLYVSAYDVSREEEAEAFEHLFGEIEEACEGLLAFIGQLQEVSKLKGVGLVHEATMNLRTNEIGVGRLAKISTTFSKNARSKQDFDQSPLLLSRMRTGITSYINKNGVAISLERRPQSKSRGYWMNKDNMKKELIAWSEQNNNSPATMPVIQDIKDSGNYMLFHSITKYHGGKGEVAKTLGWALDKRVNRGFWHERENILKALNPYLDCTMNEDGVEECIIPTKSSLIEKGRQDLVGAIDRSGGFKLVADLLNLKIRQPGRKALYPDLQDWEKYKQRLESWVDKRNGEGEGEGKKNKWPKMHEMMSSGAGDLHYATKKYHGGFKKVSRKMGWQ
jgi:protein-tyrosine-phosphatase